jgi:hypothetical protein
MITPGYYYGVPYFSGQWRMPHLTPENADRLTRLVALDSLKDELTGLRMTADGVGQQAATAGQY